MSDDAQKKLEQARKERGDQLRALVVSWVEDKTFVQALAEQQAKIDSGELTPNEDWSIMADEILGGFMSYSPQKMEWPDAEQDNTPKIITP